jgi:long-subunit acyl-CoA synthetase (AMP-forming)
MASIIYTSGSTGKPKGAMVSFDAMFQAAKGFCQTMGLLDERFISYMPLSHVYERLAVESIALFSGSSLWFAESLDTFVEDVKRARPTIFYSVPRLWTKFQLAIFEKMPPEKLDRLLKIPIINRIVKKKIRKGLGLECARFGFSAGATMSKELISWYGKLGLEVLDVYAMTENFGYSHFVRPGQIKPGYVGSPHHGVEHKLSDQGEILVKSPGMMMGYFNNPEATGNTFDENGFLRTGDVGFIDESGDLKVIGRLKCYQRFKNQPKSSI